MPSADRLNTVLDRLAEHRFYAGRLPRTVADEAEFAATVPLMGRADLVAEMAKPGYGGFGGTSPVRINMTPMGAGLVPIFQTRGDLDHLIAACGTHLAACGIGPGDICVVTFGYHLFVAGLFYQTQMEAHGIACIPLGPGETERAAAVCRDHGVTVLAGSPSFSLRLIEAGMPPPKVFFAGGEALTGNPSLYAAVRAAMPDTTVIDSFSLSEVLPVGRTFPGGHGVHVFDELVHAEVIDPDTGAPVADGERGELVLTHLVKEAQPLLRYRTGDLTVKRTTAPVHGRTINLPRVVFGRTDEMVKVKGVKVYPSEIRAMLLGLDGLSGRYRLTVDAAAGGDRILLLLEGIGTEETLEQVAGRFKSQTLIGADEITLATTLEDGPDLIDRRGGA
jgi:phenylacetate-CoA ligase